MKRILPIFFLLFCITTPQSFAVIWTPENLPMVHLQDAKRWVCNPDGILSQAAVDSMDATLTQMNINYGIETVVIAVKQVTDGDCYTFGINLSRKYGIGGKKNNRGLIIILSTEDRRYQILTGNGLEGSLPDAICKRIENRIMVPLLKEENWDSAMIGCVKSINNYLSGDKSLLNDNNEKEGQNGFGFIGLAAFIIIFIVVILNNSRGRKCPNCGKKQLRATTQTFLYTKNHSDYFRVIYVCSNCKFTESRIETRPHEDNNNGTGGFIAGALLGSLLGRGSGGGGNFGGTFGGGSFGGGGAGGGF